MNTVVLSDKEIRTNLFPLSLTRPVADFRCGILTIKEKWKQLLGMEVILEGGEPVPESALVFSSGIIPSKNFVESLSANQPDWNSVRIVQFPWHIMLWNDWALREDFELLTHGRQTAPVPATVMVSGPENIFLEEGAKLSHCILNAEAGPIYIGKNAEVMEGAMIRGPFALCEGSVVKMGSAIYGATTIGPFSTVGGEIKNSVIFGYSNKAHEGYLGDSVIGEWCNLGAGTTNSNMKNNAAEVRMWNHQLREYVGTGLAKCGLIMGDYSKAGINTSFNTGSMVGVCANIFGESRPPKFVPGFSWGNAGEKYTFDKAIRDIENWKKLKGCALSEQERTVLRLIFEEN